MGIIEEAQARLKAKQESEKVSQTAQTQNNSVVTISLKEYEELKKLRENAIVVDDIQQPSDSVTYFARLLHSKYVFSDGAEIYFHTGRIIINEKTFPGKYHRQLGLNQGVDPNNRRPRYQVYQEELDAICPPLGNNPMIFKQDAIPQVPLRPQIKQNAVAEGDRNQTDLAIVQTGAVKINQEMGISTTDGMPTDVNGSTADPDLLKAAKLSGAIETAGGVVPIDPANLNNMGMSSSVSGI